MIMINGTLSNNAVYKIKSLLRRNHSPDKEYMVNIDCIKIQPAFMAKNIGWRKWIQKLDYYYKTGEFQSKVVLNQDFELVNGYSTYKIAEKFNMGKVPVCFLPAEEDVVN